MNDMKIQYFYRKNNQQIDAVYKNCTTKSTKYTEGTMYTKVTVIDPQYEITRNNKVILDDKGVVIGTIPNVNSSQPVPNPIKNTKLEDLLVTKGLVTQKEIDDTKKKK